MKNFLKKSLALILVVIVFIILSSAAFAPTEDDETFTEHHKVVKLMTVQSAHGVLKKSEETTINYSNDIHVLVTIEDKNLIQEKIKEMDKELEMLAKVIYREARGESKEYQAAVAWCVLNRVDSPRYASTIERVITSPNQFAWYPNTPVEEEHLNLAKDVVTRWLLEKEGYENVGRTLPDDYFFFAGDGVHNYFRKNFDSTTYWNWELDSPY